MFHRDAGRGGDLGREEGGRASPQLSFLLRQTEQSRLPMGMTHPFPIQPWFSCVPASPSLPTPSSPWPCTLTSVTAAPQLWPLSSPSLSCCFPGHGHTFLLPTSLFQVLTPTLTVICPWKRSGACLSPPRKVRTMAAAEGVSSVHSAVLPRVSGSSPTPKVRATGTPSFKPGRIGHALPGITPWEN